MTALARPAPDPAAAMPLCPDPPLAIGLLTPHNALDRQAFSGTAFHAAAALARRPDVTCRLIGAHHRAPGPLGRFFRPRSPSPRVETVDLAGLDVVVGLVATALLSDLARLGAPPPYLHVTDATPAFLRDIYGWAVPETADALEAGVALGAAATVYSSTHMAARARLEFALPARGTHVVPFGINLDTLPGARPEKPPLAPLNLLFVGADWTRKGGDMAVATLDRLRLGGLDARLTVAGRIPDAVARHPGVTSVGFLDKNRAADRARLTRLYETAHLLLLPTQADCTPMVLAEAMAHGAPVLAGDTGGVAELIGGAGAGRAMPETATAEDWAEAIRALTGDPDVWALASDAAFDRASTRLTWDRWAGDIAGLARACSRKTAVAA